MGESKDPERGGAGSAIDTAIVRELAELLAETGLTEIEIETDDLSIRLSRAAAVAPAAPAPAAMAARTPPASAAAAEPAAAAPADHAGALKSPMVGTAFLAPEPGAAPFVTVGQAVKPGDTLLVIEAMKVMNAIHAPAAGTVMAVLVENAQPVEYDPPLVVIA